MAAPKATSEYKKLTAEIAALVARRQEAVQPEIEAIRESLPDLIEASGKSVFEICETTLGEIKGELRRLAEKEGKTIAQLLDIQVAEKPKDGGDKDKPKAVKEPKYRHPENNSLTWAGGPGRKPKWVEEHIENGGKLEDLLIKKIDAPAASPESEEQAA